MRKGEASGEALADQGDGVVTVGELRAECDSFLDAIAAEGGSRAEAEEHAPGGPQNPSVGARGWLRYYQQLNRTHAVLVGHGSGGSVRSRSQAIDAVMAAAGADVPVAVTMSNGVTRHAFPKSLHALRWLDTLDVELQVVAQQVAVARASGGAPDVAVVAVGPLLHSLGVRLWAWIITHKGCELPFEDEDTSPTPPRWTKTLTISDVLALYTAHRDVNRDRLDVMARAFPSDPGSPSRLPLSGMLGSFASDHDLPTVDVLRRMSLGSIFAQTVASAQSSREMNARTEERARS